MLGVILLKVIVATRPACGWQRRQLGRAHGLLSLLCKAHGRPEQKLLHGQHTIHTIPSSSA